MNQDIKQQWIEALESGEYKQGREQLRENQQFCCLGVLCDLHRKAGLGHWGADWYQAKASASDISLPSDVWEWAGLNTSEPRDTGGTKLSVLNDKGVSFAEIAELIRESL